MDQIERLQKEFFEFRKSEIQRLKLTYETYKRDHNTRLHSDFAKKYPFLKHGGYPTLKEVFTWEDTKKRFDYESFSKPLLDHFISKITGIFKHGQTEKTYLCNLRILSNVELGILSIAISKNTLNAKEQWEERLISALKKKFPHRPLSSIILIISSKKNTLDGNATHCKNVKEAKSAILSGNFMVIFVCSNNRRIEDILDILDCYDSLAEAKRLPMDVQQDEAHDPEEGVPSKRNAIENIIMNPYVKSFVPVSASPEPIFVAGEPLWEKANLERNAIDYTHINNVVSTSENYSSISDAMPLYFNQLKNHTAYTDYKVTEFDEETFDEADIPGFYARWGSPEDVKADKDRRRQLEFCQFMAFEKEAANLGMNLLDNFYRYSYRDGDSYIETPLILKDVFNIHILTTPCRVALTIHLMKHALTQDYNPICIGLYRGELHIRYKNKYSQVLNKKFCELDVESDSRELNNKIHDVLEYLKSVGESTERPLLIFGNYKPTGASITFVNYKYGTIRSDTLLPVLGQSREKNYQGFLRCCYMDTKFKEYDPSFVHPPKWIIGSEQSILDALTYEQQNDERVLRLTSGSNVPLLPPVVPMEYPEDDVKNISVPCKIMIENPDEPMYESIRSILSQATRSAADKKNLLKYIRLMKENGSLEFTDHLGKFDFHRYTVKDVRTWKKHGDEEILARREEKGSKYTPFEADYRFREYDSHHRNNMPYMNNKANISENHCEILAAYDMYEYEGFKNHKTKLWLSYRYPL
jgi:hypothetical protein